MASSVMDLEPGAPSHSKNGEGRRARWRARLGSIVLMIALLSVCVYVFTRSALLGILLRFFGANAALAIAIALLVLLASSALLALFYGFGLDNPLSRRGRYRNRRD
jgi:hypothetical protein